MRRYETVFIVNSDLSEEQQQSLFDKVKGLVPEDQAMLVEFDEWGHKRLAYEIKKQTRGYYVLMDFCGDGALVKEIERNMRLDDRVLKYMTVLKDEAVDVEALMADIEAAKEQASKPESPEEVAYEPAREMAGEPTRETAGEPTTEMAGEPTREMAGEPTRETAGEPTRETAGEPTREMAGEPAHETAGEGEEKADVEATEMAVSPLSETEVPEEMPESSSQEEQEDGTT